MVLAAQLGTPKGFVHPEAHIHQIRIDKDTVGGVKVDINNVLKSDYGQWSKSGADIV